jgi:hypothetical protein
MERATRTIILAALLAAMAVAAQTASAAQRIQFTGADRVFGVVATASANVTVDAPFLRVTLEQGTIRATALARGSEHVTGYRINLGYTRPSSEWDMMRKSERVPLDIVLDHLETFGVAPRTLTIPIDGVDSLKDKWLVFEVDVGGTPPGFTYSHSQKLDQGR